MHSSSCVLARQRPQNCMSACCVEFTQLDWVYWCARMLQKLQGGPLLDNAQLPTCLALIAAGGKCMQLACGLCLLTLCLFCAT